MDIMKGKQQERKEKEKRKTKWKDQVFAISCAHFTLHMMLIVHTPAQLDSTEKKKLNGLLCSIAHVSRTSFGAFNFPSVAIQPVRIPKITILSSSFYSLVVGFFFSLLFCCGCRFFFVELLFRHRCESWFYLFSLCPLSSSFSSIQLKYR